MGVWLSGSLQAVYDEVSLPASPRCVSVTTRSTCGSSLHVRASDVDDGDEALLAVRRVWTQRAHMQEACETSVVPTALLDLRRGRTQRAQLSEPADVPGMQRCRQARLSAMRGTRRARRRARRDPLRALRGPRRARVHGVRRMIVYGAVRAHTVYLRSSHDLPTSKRADTPPTPCARSSTTDKVCGGAPQSPLCTPSPSSPCSSARSPRQWTRARAMCASCARGWPSACVSSRGLTSLTTCSTLIPVLTSERRKAS